MKWLGCLIVCGLASSGFAERRVALLVGIADPVGAKWAQSSAIEGPPEDVRRMGRLLGDYYV
jgi:hypothetical protein